MKRTGEILRKAREAKGLSINELAISLKINSKALTAIEDGDLTKLPARTFLRGFVQSYAQALKINVDEVLNVFAEEMGVSRPQAAPTPAPSAPAVPAPIPTSPVKVVPDIKPEPKPAPKSEPTAEKTSPALTKPAPEGGLKELEESNGLKFFLLGGLGLVLVGLIFGTKKIIDRYQREKEESPEVVVATPLEHEQTTLTAPPTTAPAETVAEKPVEKPVEKPTEKPAETAPVAETKPEEKKHPVATAPMDGAPSMPLQSSLGFPLTSPSPSPLRTESPPVSTKKEPPVETKPVEPPPPVETKVAEAKPEEKKPEEKKAEETAEAKPEEKKPAKKSLELIIEALDSVDVEYVSSTGDSQKIHLDADQVHTIRAKAGLKLTVSNGGAVNLILNGRDIGVPGGLGTPVSLVY